MSYRIWLGDPAGVPAPCTFVPSTAAPGKTLIVEPGGNTLVVLPNGSERSTSEPPGPNWDSPWTWGEVYGELIIYQSASGTNPGVARAYRMVVK